MKKIISPLLRIAVLLIAFFLSVACTVLLLIQTEWAKGQISHLIQSTLEQQGIDAHIEGLEGKLPFSWKIDEIRLKLPSSDLVCFENVSLRIAF
ncbi:MAG: hypothetical protein HYZ48_00065, partial [Chlamydiales bacterium]|nr:hypothetical protein [Chlamydiales bacterium]